MERELIDNFFADVAKRITQPTRVYLTGGTVSFPWGGNRPPEGASFGMHTCGPAAMDYQRLLEDASETVGLPIRVKGMPAFLERLYMPDFKRGAKLYRRYGRLCVYLLDWKYWSLGKLVRNDPGDLNDIKAVFNKLRPSPYEVLRIWGRSIRTGATVLYLRALVDTVEHFFTKHGPEIWGEAYDLKKALQGFQSKMGEMPGNFPKRFPIFPAQAVPLTALGSYGKLL